MGMKLGLSPLGRNMIRLLDNSIHGKLFVPGREQVMGNGGVCRTRSFVICKPLQILFG
jgi:hypothetical protein